MGEFGVDRDFVALLELSEEVPLDLRIRNGVLVDVPGERRRLREIVLGGVGGEDLIPELVLEQGVAEVLQDQLRLALVDETGCFAEELFRVLAQLREDGGLDPERIDPTVRRVSLVRSAISPMTSYCTWEATVAVSRRV